MEVEVTLSDQKLINRFARLNAKCEELEADLKANDRKVDNFSEALDEMALEDDDQWIRSGDVFARMSAADAQQWVEGLRRALQSAGEDTRRRVVAMRDEMADIKTTLYSKFGANINLEYEDE